MRRCATDRKRLAGHRHVGDRGLALHVERRRHPAHRPRVAGRGDLWPPGSRGGGRASDHHGAAPPAAAGPQPAPRRAGGDALSALLPVHRGRADLDRRPRAVHHLYGARYSSPPARRCCCASRPRESNWAVSPLPSCGHWHPRRFRPRRARRLGARRPGGAGIGRHVGGLRPGGTLAAPRESVGNLRVRRLRLGGRRGASRRRGHPGRRRPRGYVAVDRAAGHRTAGRSGTPSSTLPCAGCPPPCPTSSRRRKCPRGSSSAFGWCRRFRGRRRS